MSAEREHTIFCDVCLNWERVTSRSESIARAHLAKLGWVRRIQVRAPPIDLCPRCKDKPAKMPRTRKCDEPESATKQLPEGAE